MNFPRKLKSLLKLTFGGGACFALINLYKGNEKFYKDFIMPATHLLDPETAHRLAIFTSKHRLLPKSSFVDPESLTVNMFGKTLSNPLGIAAGFDKHGEAILGLIDMGFGFVEIGSVTPKPQDGNERPRVFRLKEDSAVINRYGFNSDGHDLVHERLIKLNNTKEFEGIVGVNLGKNKEAKSTIDDYTNGVIKFGNIADYLVINISSPNTPGLRNMQNKQQLQQLLKNVIAARNQLSGKQPPIFVKLAPDLTFEERKDIADVIKAKDCRVDGLIISNTTVTRPTGLLSEQKLQMGGLSGQPIKDLSTHMISDMYKLTNGMTIIGVGGISSGADAYEKIKAGATVLQIYSSLIYEGPPIVAKIKKELSELLAEDGYNNISEAVGKSVK